MDIELTKITSRGQIVIPQEIREEKGIKEGEKFLVFSTDDSIVLKQISNLEQVKNIKEFEKTFKSMWKTAKKRKITKKDIETEIKEYRKKNA